MKIIRKRERRPKVSPPPPHLRETETVRLIVGDRYPLFAQAVQQIFDECPEFKVVARCEDGDSALRAARLYRPDVLVIDIDMPGKDGVAVLREIKAMNTTTRVVLLVQELQDRQAVQVLRLNVDGIVSKTARSETLTDCVRKVLAGTQWIEPEMLRRLVDRLIVPTPRPAEGVLTPAEQKVLHFVAEGLVNKEIADQLHISEGTVKNHLHNVYVKLGITGRREAVKHVREAGLLLSQAV